MSTCVSTVVATKDGLNLFAIRGISRQRKTHYGARLASLGAKQVNQ